jgi:hypothetical protein
MTRLDLPDFRARQPEDIIIELNPACLPVAPLVLRPLTGSRHESMSLVLLNRLSMPSTMREPNWVGNLSSGFSGRI